MTNADDALLAAALGADAVGFIFAPSSRQVTAGRVKAIVDRLPSTVLPVGVFRNQAPDRVLDLTIKSGVRAVQLHGNESPDETAWVAERVPAVIRAVPAGSRAMHEHEAFGRVRFMLDGLNPGSGETFDWSLLEGFGDREYILAGGLTPSNVRQAIDTLHPWGVDVATGVEQRPGIKDPSLVRQFITNVRALEVSTGTNSGGLLQ